MYEVIENEHANVNEQPFKRGEFVRASIKVSLPTFGVIQNFLKKHLPKVFLFNKTKKLLFCLKCLLDLKGLKAWLYLAFFCRFLGTFLGIS